MSKVNDGGPAFPVTEIERDRHQEVYMHTAMTGMTLRDYFAGQALAAIAHANGLEDLAMRAYALADAMLTARDAK